MVLMQVVPVMRKNHVGGKRLQSFKEVFNFAARVRKKSIPELLYDNFPGGGFRQKRVCALSRFFRSRRTGTEYHPAHHRIFLLFQKPEDGAAATDLDVV